MKNFYIAVQIINESNKKYSYVLKVGESDNLLTKLKIPNIVFANICQTKKQAEEIVHVWNQGFIKNHEYMFNEECL